MTKNPREQADGADDRWLMKTENLKTPIIQIGTFRTSTPNGIFRGVYIRFYRVVLGFGSNILSINTPPENPKRSQEDINNEM